VVGTRHVLSRVLVATLDDVFRRPHVRARPRYVALKWPTEYANPGSSFPGEQLLQGIREVGIHAGVDEIPQPAEGIVLIRVGIGSENELVAFDHTDRQDIDEVLAGRVLVYFKQQFAPEGYEQPNVVPAGYTPANGVVYRYLPLLRAVRSSRRFRYDVYGRFGLRYGGQELRRNAFAQLSARTDFSFEGSLFRYPGGPEKVPYRKYLFEIPRAKVCVDMPGNGDLTTRLVDYLAVGACVVKRPPRARLPVHLVDGVHVVYCASNLSDLGDVCVQLVGDDESRETIARNARDFFDRHLHRRQLAERFVDEITDARGKRPQPVQRVQPVFRPSVRYRVALSPVVLLILAAFLTAVALPRHSATDRTTRARRAFFTSTFHAKLTPPASISRVYRADVSVPSPLGLLV
jgi:glycosyl transferase family 1